MRLGGVSARERGVSGRQDHRLDARGQIDRSRALQAVFVAHDLHHREPQADAEQFVRIAMTTRRQSGDRAPVGGLRHHLRKDVFGALCPQVREGIDEFQLIDEGGKGVALRASRSERVGRRRTGARTSACPKRKRRSRAKFPAAVPAPRARPARSAAVVAGLSASPTAEPPLTFVGLQLANVGSPGARRTGTRPRRAEVRDPRSGCVPASDC